jgi:hypothetical protein
MCAESITDALLWLRRHFRPRAKIVFTINWDTVLQIWPSLNPTYSMEIRALTTIDSRVADVWYRIPDLIYPPTLRAHKTELSFDFRSLIYLGNLDRPIFRCVEEFAVLLYFTHAYHLESTQDPINEPSWLRYLSLSLNVNEGQDKIPFPSLRRIRAIQRARYPTDLTEETVTKLLKDIIRVRRSAGVPLEAVVLEWQKDNKQPSSMISIPVD